MKLSFRAVGLSGVEAVIACRIIMLQNTSHVVSKLYGPMPCFSMPVVN